MKKKRVKPVTVSPEEIRDILPKSIAQIMDDKGWGAERRVEKEIELVTAGKTTTRLHKIKGVIEEQEPLYQIQGQAIDRMHKLAADYPSEKQDHTVKGNVVFGWETDLEES